MGIPDNLTCLLRYMCAGQEATVRTGRGTRDWFQIGKGVRQDLLSPCLFNLYAEYIMRNSGLDEAQAGIKIARSHHFIANRWETMETVRDFILGGSKITADGNCSHEIKRHLLLGSKAMTNLDSMLKSRDILCPQRPHSQSLGFSSSHIRM